MNKLVVVFLAASSCLSCGSPKFSAEGAAAGASKATAAWESQAANVSIIRDDHGIAHVYGKTDADAVFGIIYAQAEDDFNRVETNYLNSMGRLAEAEGEGEIYRDLRMKIFIDPADMQAQYDDEPRMAEAADGRVGGRAELLPRHPSRR